VCVSLPPCRLQPDASCAVATAAYVVRCTLSTSVLIDYMRDVLAAGDGDTYILDAAEVRASG
jgi:hypothetical protein